MSMLYTAGRFKYLTDAGTNASGYRLYTFASGTTTFLTTYTDSTLTTPSTYTTDGSGLKYITLNSRGEAQVWLGSSAYTFVVADASGVTKETTNGVRSSDAIASEALDAFKAQLADDTGATLVGHLSGETGAVATTLGEVADRMLDAVGDFGCDNTGATNTTSGLLSFYNACIDSGKKGFIPAGSYLVTAGVLVFDNGFVEKANMHVETAGENHVTFLRADSTNSPMLYWKNGTASSGVGQYWIGGYHGGITISQNSKTTSSGQHGVALTGVWGMRFGWIRVEDNGGSAVYIPPALYGGSNPDPYAVTACKFDAIEANRCKLYALQNDNYVGLNFCTVGYLRAINTEAGGWYGFGAANTIEKVSMGSCKGWAFDDGCALANTGGSPSRFAVREAELDDVQYGFRLNKASLVEIAQTRFVHRYNFSALNPSGGYWPRKVIQMAGGTAPSVNGISADFTHRIEAGGLKADMGAFVDGSSNGNVTNVRIAQRVIDNAGFGFSDTDLFTGLSSLATVDLRRDGYRIADQMKKQYVRAEATVSTTIANTGFTSTKIQFPTEVADGLSRWNGADTFTASFAGPYRVKARIALTLSAAGKQVRMAWMVNSSAAAHKTMYSQGTGVQYYELDDIVTLAAGDTLWLSADQNDVASKTLSAPINIGIDNHVLIEAL